MKHILVVDDDVHISEVLDEILRKENYLVTHAYSGTEALYALSSNKPDLILLDLMLPGMNGDEVLTKIKEIPVIILSAKVDVKDKVALLLGGAVDYITKPFHTDELLARISIQLRKATPFIDKSLLEFNDIQLNADTYIVQSGENKVKLTRTESAILKLLMQNPMQVITKSVLLDRISEDTSDCMESSLRVHISNLRKKLRCINDKEYVEAVWGIGFKMKEM